MDNHVAVLHQLGFSEYEARAYVALLQHQPLNGYELARRSSLPRANVYAVLQKLEQRGAVVRVETADGTRYAAVPPTEVIARLGRQFEASLQAAHAALNAITTPVEQEYVWNARGYAVLLDHAAACIAATTEQLLVAIWPEEAHRLAPSLAHAEARGVAITTLCLAVCTTECGGCHGNIYRYRVAPEQRQRWLVLVPDGAEVLTSEISADRETLTVRTRHRLLVDLASWYIRHSIALAAVVDDLGERLDPLLAPETRAILASLSPSGALGGWLDHVRQLLRQHDR